MDGSRGVFGNSAHCFLVGGGGCLPLSDLALGAPDLSGCFGIVQSGLLSSEVTALKTSDFIISDNSFTMHIELFMVLYFPAL